MPSLKHRYKYNYFKAKKQAPKHGISCSGANILRIPLRLRYKRAGISVKNAIGEKMATLDLNIKKRDFEHLLFNINVSERILHFAEYADSVL